jgi:aminobenzoyl-glutamate utilization protein A
MATLATNVIALRREFHRHPELGYTEFRTAARVVELLRQWGYDVAFGDEAMVPEARGRLPEASVADAAYEAARESGADPAVLERMKGGLTAVVGTRPNGAGPTIGFRFDMDALPVDELNEASHLPQREGFASGRAGLMHACGHDGHTAIGLALAERLAQTNPPGTIKLFFQPAEEGGEGAKAMAERGVADDVDRLFCMHLGCNVPLGALATGSIGFLAARSLEATFTGAPAHAAAAPELGRNALLGAATALLNLQAMPRFSTGITRVNVGQFEGGTATNVIAHRARLRLEVRAETDAEVEDLAVRSRRILEHAAAMHELTVEITSLGQAPGMTCDPEVRAFVREQAEASGLFPDVRDVHFVGASEDAGYLMSRVQARGGDATYMIVGTPLAAPHHHFAFDIDEESLSLSVDLLERLATSALRS